MPNGLRRVENIPTRWNCSRKQKNWWTCLWWTTAKRNVLWCLLKPALPVTSWTPCKPTPWVSITNGRTCWNRVYLRCLEVRDNLLVLWLCLLSSMRWRVLWGFRVLRTWTSFTSGFVIMQCPQKLGTRWWRVLSFLTPRCGWLTT